MHHLYYCWVKYGLVFFFFFGDFGLLNIFRPCMTDRKYLEVNVLNTYK